VVWGVGLEVFWKGGAVVAIMGRAWECDAGGEDS